MTSGEIIPAFSSTYVPVRPASIARGWRTRSGVLLRVLCRPAAQDLANHSDPRTTKLYDRRKDLATLGEIERTSHSEISSVHFEALGRTVAVFAARRRRLESRVFQAGYHGFPWVHRILVGFGVKRNRFRRRERQCGLA